MSTEHVTLAPDLIWNPFPLPSFKGDSPDGYEAFEEEWIDRPAIERMDEMVRRRGAAIAVDDGTTQLSYADFKKLVDDYAAQIEAVAPVGRPVVAVLYTTSAYPVMLFASIAVGRTLVFIDASLPPARQQAIIDDVSPGAVLVSNDRPADHSFIPESIPRVVLDLHNPGPRARPPHRKTDLMVITFTSGTTGKPKGLATGEYATIASIHSLADRLRLSHKDTVLSLSAPGVLGWGEAFIAIMLGARLRVCDLRLVGLAEAFRQLAADEVTFLNFVPSALRNIFRVPGAREAFHGLRLLNTVGESMLASDLQLFRSVLPATARVSNTLSSTEALGVFQWIVDDAKVDGAVVPVGYVMPHKEIALIDEEGRNVPPGEVGRIVIRSRFMASGTWENGKLQPPPSYRDPERPGWRIFQSGDYARMRPDGLAEFAGRKDQQVKIRGNRADLGIVEAAMRGHPGVADAATVLLSPEAKLVGFVVATPQVPVSVIDGARPALARVLPEYMVPAQIHILEAIPRLANHKPDLRRLAELARGAPPA